MDGDGCPVKDEAYVVAARYGVPVALVANSRLSVPEGLGVEMVLVDQGPDAADDWIVENLRPGDVVVTADIPLAARCVEAGAAVLKPNGEALTVANVGNALATRDLMTDLRAADPFRQGGGKAFSKADRSRFRDALERAVRVALRS